MHPPRFVVSALRRRYTPLLCSDLRHPSCDTLSLITRASPTLFNPPSPASQRRRSARLCCAPLTAWLARIHKHSKKKQKMNFKKPHKTRNTALDATACSAGPQKRTQMKLVFVCSKTHPHPSRGVQALARGILLSSHFIAFHLILISVLVFISRWRTRRRR